MVNAAEAPQGVDPVVMPGLKILLKYEHHLEAAASK